MKNQIKIIALGGGQNVGASCYYVSVDECNFLLDCGCGVSNGVIYGPNLNTLLETACLESLSELDAVFISHSHYDHIGFIPKFHCMAASVPIFTTVQTKALAYYQIWDTGNKEFNVNTQTKARNEIIAESALDSITEVGYAQKMCFPKFSVTFYEAGHIPGAAMIFIETKSRKMLYTGDFAKGETPLAHGYQIPDNIAPDTLIMCGLNAKNPECVYSHKPGKIIRRILPYLSQNNSAVLKVRQLTKGIELIQMIGSAMERGVVSKKHIFVDDDIYQIAERLECFGVPVLNQYCRRFPKNCFEDGIYITENNMLDGYFQSVDVDFTLHASYPELKELVEKILPDNVVVVHVGRKDIYSNNHILEMDIEDDISKNMSFIYPQNDEIYSI